MSKFNLLLLLISTLASSFPHEGFSNHRTDSVKFISATPTSHVSYEMLRAFTENYGQKKISRLLKYGVQSYTVVYETKWKAAVIQASGLLLVPTGIKEPAPLLSIQHGTTFSNDEAPSVSGYTGMELFASAGYIVLMPDYIGYGNSSDIFHPYYDEQHSADAVIDMIVASKQFLRKKIIAFNDKLFLAGYSEGGYVTLATAAALERKPSHNITVTAVAAGAGGYDLMQMLKSVTTDSYYTYPAYLAFVLMSYNHTYDWNKPLSYFFKKPYADALTNYLSGVSEGWSLNSKLTTNLSSLFDNRFFTALKTRDGESDLKLALKKNSIEGWKTKIPIRLYHGTKDEIIPFNNSEATLRSFHSAGSTHVTLTSIPGGTHGSSLFPMMESFIPWFLEMR